MALNLLILGTWIALTSVSVFVLVVLVSLMKRSLEGSGTPSLSVVTTEKLWAISRIEESQVRLEAREYIAALDLTIEAVRDILNQLMRIFSSESEEYNIAEMAYILAETKIVEAGSVDQIYFLNKLKLKAITGEISGEEAAAAIRIATRFVYKQKLGQHEVKRFGEKDQFLS